MNKINPGYEIERLLQFGLKKQLISKWDVVPVRNSLMALLKVNEPFEGEKLGENGIPDAPLEILNNLLDYRITSYNVCYTKLLRQEMRSLIWYRPSIGDIPSKPIFTYF